MQGGFYDKRDRNQLAQYAARPRHEYTRLREPHRRPHPRLSDAGCHERQLRELRHDRGDGGRPQARPHPALLRRHRGHGDMVEHLGRQGVACAATRTVLRLHHRRGRPPHLQGKHEWSAADRRRMQPRRTTRRNCLLPPPRPLRRRARALWRIRCEILHRRLDKRRTL